MLKKLDDFLQESCNNALCKNSNAEPTKTTAVQQKITKAISESSDLIAALECVGAMYGIPATNIISDDAATSICVKDDTITAPPIPNPAKQTKPIMQAIGTVLDYISQRIDDKLDNMQMDNIIKGRNEDAIANANPLKGKCVGRYEDDNGGEILAYDTGLVDAPNTPAAFAKIAELRKTNQIPSIDPSDDRPSKIPGLSYFTDEDDITTDVDMTPDTSPDATIDQAPDIETNDVADQIQESAYHLDMISKFNNTRHLGYDLLQKHGFDYIKKMDSVIMEAKTDDKNDDKEDNNKKGSSDKNDSSSESKTKLKVEDFKHMKFDNTNILKAVECFNKAREEQVSTKNGKLDLDKLVNDPNFSKGITYLDKQFDCHIALKMIKSKKYAGDNCSTEIIPDIKQKISVSKSKGFQLGGLPINIIHFHRHFESSSPDDPALFGQSVVGTLCHEIFHNIAAALQYENTKNAATFAMTMRLASAAKTPKEKRIILTNYVDSLEKMSKCSLFDKMAKKKMVKQLSVLSAVNEENIGSVKKSIKKGKDEPDEFTDKLIKRLKRAKSKTGGMKSNDHIFGLITTGAPIITMALIPNLTAIETGLFGVLGIIGGFNYITNILSDSIYKSKMKKYKNNEYFEEYYCDLFAAMYQLPKVFFLSEKNGEQKNKFTANEISVKKLDEIAKLEKDVFTNVMSKYPTDLERTHAGVTAAKKILENDDIDDSTKKYCQWVVDNFSNVQKTSISTLYNSSTFNPKEAEDLDEHLQKLITDNSIMITESFSRWINSDKIIM